MKPLIDRTLFWFKDGNDQILLLNNKFFPWAMMFNRLLNERYQGKKIEFVNLYFKTKQTYILHPQSKEHYIHYYGGHLWYNDVIDLIEFTLMSEKAQLNYIWKRCHQILIECSESIRNESLLQASKYAYERGLALELNPNFKILQLHIDRNNIPMDIALSYDFQKTEVYSKLTIESGGRMILEKIIDNAPLGNEFFFDIYKKMEIKNNMVVIQGRKEVSYLPLRVQIPADI